MRRENTNTKVSYRKSVHFLAAAALSTALLAGQIQPSMVRADGPSISVSSIIPDNITIDSPVSLAEISLPDSKYGTLSWVDSSSVPTERVQSYDVVFHPSSSVDLSRISGWDGTSDAIYGSVTVVVSSLDSGSEEETEESWEETENQEEVESGGTEESGEGSDENEMTGESGEDSDGSEMTEEPGKEETDEGGKTEDPTVTETPDGDASEEGTPGEGEEPKKEDSETEEKEDQESENSGEAGETKEDTIPEVTENPEVTETPDPKKDSEATEAPEKEEQKDEKKEDKDNIFDRPKEEDKRPTVAEENLTEEEQEQRAEENHSCNGIYVSGIHLPWYVQFRATNEASYEFTNEEEANIFKSYEFELWDLKNNTEYAIPDGEYISVTVPVKEGYDYTIEHLLDSGAMETIIPSVEGSTMVFSTHSFSPFGIAGSKPLVGGDISEDGYQGNTTPAATKAPANKLPGATKAPSASTGKQSVSGSSSSGSSTSSADSGQQSGSVSSNNAGDQSNASDSVNTGDNTVIYPFVILVAAAVIIIGVVLYLKKKK